MPLNPIQLETDRLILTGYTSKELKFIFDNFSKVEIINILGHQSDEDYLKEEYKHKNGYSAYNRDFILFLLSDKKSGKIIGRCGLHNWNKDHNRAEIGYNMSFDTFKRKGLMSEAVAKIIDYGFKVLQLHRIEALVSENNIPSKKILEKFNFTKEALLREHYFNGNKYENSLLFSILNSEYFD